MYTRNANKTLKSNFSSEIKKPNKVSKSKASKVSNNLLYITKNMMDVQVVVKKMLNNKPVNAEVTTKEPKEPSDNKIIGFLGLSLIGLDILKNSYKYGHKIIIWNHAIPEAQCNELKSVGVQVKETINEVFEEADITFSALFDLKLLNKVIYEECAFLESISQSKGFVQLSGIDVEISKKLEEAINENGGRYLEVQYQGTDHQATQSDLVIFTAGDKSLYIDCFNFLTAVSKHLFYLDEVGNACRMNLVLQLMNGVATAGLAEGMTLAQHAGLDKNMVLKVLQIGQFANPTLVTNCKAMIDKSNNMNSSLEVIQKDLQLSLQMGNKFDIPLPLAAIANESYKHAKHHGYAQRGSSAI